MKDTDGVMVSNFSAINKIYVLCDCFISKVYLKGRKTFSVNCNERGEGQSAADATRLHNRVLNEFETEGRHGTKASSPCIFFIRN